MPKKLLATTIILLLAITMLSLIPLLGANFIPTSAEIRIHEPKRQSIELYEDTPIPIAVTVREPENAPQNYHQITNIYYSIDGQPAVEIADITKKTNQPLFSGTVTEYYAYTAIDNIESGSHVLMVYAVDDVGNRLSAKTGFAYQTIDVFPNVTVFSPLNMTYLNTTKLALNFTADDFIYADYSLDSSSRTNVLYRNETLTGLTNGVHTLEFHVQTDFGPFTQTTRFVIDGVNSQIPSPDSTLTPARESSDESPLSTTAIIVVVVVVSVGGLLVYLRRKRIHEAK
jgi:hypothetical protein